MTKNYLLLLRHLLLSSLLILFLNSCSKDDDEVVAPEPEKPTTPVAKETGRELLAIRFTKADNPSLTGEAYVHAGKNNLYYITLPNDLKENNLTVELVSSKKSAIRVNGNTLVVTQGKHNNADASIGKATVNINNVITVEVISESGIRNSIDVLAQPGLAFFDKLIYDFKEKYDIPGVSFAIANNAKTEIVYKSGIGYGIKESKTRVQTNHLFRLASMSKQHTAILTLKLIEEGKFGLDDLVFGPTGILKAKFSSVTGRPAQITVRHLLEHTTGYSTSPDFMFDSPYSGMSMEKRIEEMLKKTQTSAPGTVFAYYNTGYGILGYIIETITGKSFDAFMKETYQTVGVTDIHVGGTQSQRRPNEVAYYAQNNYNAQGSDMNVRASAGGVIASTEQLFKLLWTIDGKSNIPDLLKPETRTMMFTPSTVGTRRYALGWRANHTLLDGAFYHGGNLAGVGTFWVYGKEYSVAILCNSRSYDSYFDNAFFDLVIAMTNEAKKLNL